MFKPASAFSGFSVNDIPAAQKFYGETLGLQVDKEDFGLNIHLPGGPSVFAYPKDNHEPATFTILNFVVDNVDDAVKELKTKGVTFEHIDLGDGMVTDEAGIARGLSAGMGPDVAWFKDPAGNFLAVMQEK